MGASAGQVIVINGTSYPVEHVRVHFDKPRVKFDMKALDKFQQSISRLSRTIRGTGTAMIKFGAHLDAAPDDQVPILDLIEGAQTTIMSAIYEAKQPRAGETPEMIQAKLVLALRCITLQQIVGDLAYDFDISPNETFSLFQERVGEYERFGGVRSKSASRAEWLQNLFERFLREIGALRQVEKALREKLHDEPENEFFETIAVEMALDAAFSAAIFLEAEFESTLDERIAEPA